MSVESYDKLVENGYKIWDWNVDTLDWKSTTDQIVSNVLYYGRKHDELILLFHEREQTLDALSSSIKVLKSRGYTILPISENMIEKNFWKDNLK
jgi:peptidoglycan/xylan/chitin deacetylase (PgdA/CDA1 family)